MPAAATLIAIRNAQEQRDRAAAEAASRACGDHASCNVSAVAGPQDLATLQKRVDELQARVQAYEVAPPRQPVITLDDYFHSFGIVVCLGAVVLVVVLASWPIEQWWKQRRTRRGG